MSLYKISRRSEVFIEGKARFTLFQREIEFDVDGDNEAYLARCVDYLNNLPADLVERLCLRSISYCTAFSNRVGRPSIRFNNSLDVIEHITPRVLMIPECSNCTDRVIDLELDCTWDIEHGMEWVIREQEILYVGPFGEYTDRIDC